MVEDSQNHSWKEMKVWTKTHNLKKGYCELWYKGTALVVPEDEDL